MDTNGHPGEDAFGAYQSTTIPKSCGPGHAMLDAALGDLVQRVRFDASWADRMPQSR